MTLIGLGSSSAVDEFIQTNRNAVVTFSAHWCGPCKQSKPALQAVAAKYHADATMDVKMGIVYESDLGDDIHKYRVRAFPTHVLFRQGVERNRVEGANMAAVEQMIQSGSCQTLTGGETLGGSSSATSPADARAARLAKLAGASEAAAVPMEQDEPAAKEETTTAAATETAVDVEMKEQETEAAEAPVVDPTANLDAEAVKALTESMGFSLIRAQKGLIYGNGGTVEGAVEWLMQHQDDDDIDDPIQTQAAGVAQSYKCNECGKILSNMANLELHANKTGHSDFEESTERVKPLTAEEKAKKIAEIKELLKAKRAEREEAEKVDNTEREKQRRFMGKEMIKTREEMEIEQRKREALQRKREKEEFRKERARLRAEIEKDKAERRAHQGKLSSKLGVEGYHPDGIQYDVEDEASKETQHHRKKTKADAGKIDEYIQKISSYKAGGDGGKCLKVLKVYVGNVVDHPDEDKYKSIKMENKAFKTKVKPFLGAKHLLLAVGFAQNEAGDTLVLKEDADKQLLADTKAKLEAAVVAYG